MMKIVVLGWGSLVWQPKELKYNKSFGWRPDGPFLPIEFARLSKDGRLTLVITPNGTIVQTLYTLSEYATVEEAVLDLAVREGSGKNSIGSYDKIKREFSHEDFAYQDEIKEWLDAKEYDAVIWTNLGENWQEKRGVEISVEGIVDYLKNLPKPTTSALAEQYIRRTRKQIETEYRKKIEEALGWLPIEGSFF